MTAARFSAAEVVAAWAAAAEGDAHVDSALAGLLQAGAWPVDPPEDWPVAAWDEALLELVARLQVRAVLDGVASCPDCGERLDVTLSIPPPARHPPTPAPLMRTLDGVPPLVLTVRAPTGRDLGAALTGGAEGSVARLVARITALADERGRPLAEADRSAALARADLLAAVGDAVAELTGGRVQPVRLRCPSCEQGWTADVALAAFAVAALERSALGLLSEVHHLASAYGWTPAEILALPAAVRRHHLSLVGA